MTLIPGTKILVDSDEPDIKNNHTHFLSCVHFESTYNFEAMKKNKIFTTEFNKWFLVEFHQFDPFNIDCLSKNDEVTIAEKDNGVVTKVKMIDSNHCFGSVMFLFEGDSGNFLYAGNFRFYEKLLNTGPLQKYFSKDDTLNAVFIDLRWPLSKYPLFPPKHEVLLDVVEFVRRLSDHDHCIFVTPHFGNEELFVAIAQESQEAVYVNSEHLKVLKYLNLEHFFTDSCEESKIWVLNASELEDTRLSSLDAPYKIVSLSIDQNFDFLENKRNSVFYFPYHAHCSRDELVFFISGLKPLTVLMSKRDSKGDSYTSHVISRPFNFVKNNLQSVAPSSFKKTKTEPDRTSTKCPCRYFSANHKNSSQIIVKSSFKTSHSECSSTGPDESGNVNKAKPKADDESDSVDSDALSFWSDLNGCDVLELHSRQSSSSVSTFKR